MPAFDFDHVRLIRYLSGVCSAAGARAWLAVDPARQLELDALRQLYRAGAGIPRRAGSMKCGAS